MIVVTLNFEDGSTLGAIVINKKDPTMYDVRDGAKTWIETHLNGSNVEFIWGSREVRYTAGGAAPYNASLFLSRSVEDVVVID